MISDLRALMTVIRADNVNDVILGLRIWKQSVDTIRIHTDTDGSLEATLATISLANLTLGQEVESLAGVVKYRWPANVGEWIDPINSDLAKAEAAILKLSNLLKGLEDRKYSGLKTKTERLLE